MLQQLILVTVTGNRTPTRTACHVIELINNPTGHWPVGLFMRESIGKHRVRAVLS